MKPTGVPGTAVSSTLQKQSSLALFLPFMILSLSLANSAQLLLPFLRALFFFYEDLFSHAHRKGSWKTFFCVTYSKVTKGKKRLQPRLVNMPVMTNLYGELWPISGLFIALGLQIRPLLKQS